MIKGCAFLAHGNFLSIYQLSIKCFSKNALKIDTNESNVEHRPIKNNTSIIAQYISSNNLMRNA